MLDIESSSFSWDMLSSLHHTEHGSSTEHSEDEMNKALEVCDLLCCIVYIDILSEFMSVCQNLKNELPLKRIFEKKYVQICLFAYLLPQFLFSCVHIGHCKFWGSCLLCPIQPAREWWWFSKGSSSCDKDIIIKDGHTIRTPWLRICKVVRCSNSTGCSLLLL